MRGPGPGPIKGLGGRFSQVQFFQKCFPRRGLRGRFSKSDIFQKCFPRRGLGGCITNIFGRALFGNPFGGLFGSISRSVVGSGCLSSTSNHIGGAKRPAPSAALVIACAGEAAAADYADGNATNDAAK